MSEIKLNLIDAQLILHGTIHGSIGDACVAALSAGFRSPGVIGVIQEKVVSHRLKVTHRWP